MLFGLLLVGPPNIIQRRNRERKRARMRRGFGRFANSQLSTKNTLGMHLGDANVSLGDASSNVKGKTKCPFRRCKNTFRGCTIQYYCNSLIVGKGIFDALKRQY